jgi:hypothetical protein
MRDEGSCPVFHIPFDVLGAVIYGTELVMWIGIMICGLVLGRGEKEEQEENIELPQVSAPVTSPSIRSRHSGKSTLSITSAKLTEQIHQVYVPGNQDIQYSTLPHYGQKWSHRYK